MKRNEGDIFMSKEQHRHDVTDAIWTKIGPLMPGQKGQWGGIAHDNCRFFNGVCWTLRTGAPWRDLPEDYGKFSSVHKRYKRWCDNGTWDKILEQLIDEPDFEWLLIDASHCKVHPHAAGAIGGNQDMGHTKGGLTPKYIWPWMRMVCRSEYLSQQVPLRIADLLYLSFAD